MEKPEDEPANSQQGVVPVSCGGDNLPIYLVSPKLFVTKEHIISERASTSTWSSGLASSPFVVGAGAVDGVVAGAGVVDLRLSSLAIELGEVSEL
jgi:hypothetical protein